MAWSRAIPARQWAISAAADPRCAARVNHKVRSLQGGNGNGSSIVGDHWLWIALARLRGLYGAGRDGLGCRHPPHAGDCCRHPGRRAGLSDAPVLHDRHCRPRHLPDRRRAARPAGRHRLSDWRGAVWNRWFCGHARVGARQCTHGAGLDALPRGWALFGLPRRRGHRAAGGRPRPFGRHRLLRHPHRRHAAAIDRANRC